VGALPSVDLKEAGVRAYGGEMTTGRPFLADTWHRLPVAAKAVLGLAAVLVVAQTARATLFAVYPDRPQHAVLPFDSFHRHHSCFTAYHEAARLAGQVPNVYDLPLYSRAAGEAAPSWLAPGDPRRTLGEFHVDAYEYPPPFLLLPRILLGAGFVKARALWFGLQTAMVIAALLLLAWHLGGEWGRRFGLLAPFLYLSLPVQVCLQLGNFQIAAIALALIAMVAIARGRELAGAALLSFVVLAKLFPGVLLLVLAGRRAWRPLLLTLAGMALWVGLTLVVFGRAPFEAFLHYQLPRIESGAAFPQLRIPYAIAINQAVYALPLKLTLFGVGTGSAAACSALGWLFTIVPCAVALLLARTDRQPLLWALVLGLAAYRSPFLPQEYAALGPLLVLCLLAATAPFTTRRLLSFVPVFLLLQLQSPWSLTPSPVVAALINAVPQLLAAAVFGAAFVALRRLLVADVA
jgi:alpha-1,2-mannosyltransferase